VGTLSGTLSVTGIASVGAKKLSMGILDLNSGGTPTQFKIKTSIPWNFGGSDFTVNIKGFRYGNSTMVSLSIGWHYYNNQFYNRNAISNGAWAPTISLAKSPDGYVIIHIPSPDYWPKLYVESVYSSNSSDSYTTGWSWTDADLSDCTLIQTVPYRDLATNISGNATTASALASMNISQFSNNSGYRLQVIGDWAGTTPNDGAINIRGQYPSMTFRNTASDSMWLRHMDGSGNIQHYFATGVDSVAWSIKHTMSTNGNFYSSGDHNATYFYGGGSIRLGDMWGGAGLYRPSGSMVFGIENSDWIFSKGAVTQAYFAGGDGNLWMRWAGDWLSNLLGAKQNAATAITTANIGSQSVSYASTAGSATNATNSDNAGHLRTAYAGGQQLNPQVYFNQSTGLKAAMTGAWSVWSDTLWINGYSGGDVLQMCALHTLRNGAPRMAISVQASNSTTYGTFYEFITAYNIASQSVSYASSAGSAPNASNLNASYGVTAGDGHGLKFWGGSDTYKISMGNSAEYHYGPVTDYSIKTVIDSVNATRGFTWGVNGATPIAALNAGNGNMQIAGSLRAAGHLFTSYNGNNILLRSADNGGDAGILMQNSGGSFKFQIYGNGSDYGFLNANWAAWDIRKTIGGVMYMNGDNTYYLQTNSTSNFVALNIQGNAVIHAGNIASQSVSYASTADSATSLNSSHSISRVGTQSNANTDFQNTPPGSLRYVGDHPNITNSPGGTWWMYQNMRHSNGSNQWGTQVAWGWEDNANKLATRNKRRNFWFLGILFKQ
jgi:hypothetical protein